eukprot:659417_1
MINLRNLILIQKTHLPFCVLQRHPNLYYYYGNAPNAKLTSIPEPNKLFTKYIQEHTMVIEQLNREFMMKIANQSANGNHTGANQLMCGDKQSSFSPRFYKSRQHNNGGCKNNNNSNPSRKRKRKRKRKEADNDKIVMDDVVDELDGDWVPPTNNHKDAIECPVCKSPGDLPCNGCKKRYHGNCVRPRVEWMSSYGDWYCRRCVPHFITVPLRYKDSGKIWKGKQPLLKNLSLFLEMNPFLEGDCPYSNRHLVLLNKVLSKPTSYANPKLNSHYAQSVSVLRNLRSNGRNDSMQKQK